MCVHSVKRDKEGSRSRMYSLPCWPRDLGSDTCTEAWDQEGTVGLFVELNLSIAGQV